MNEKHIFSTLSMAALIVTMVGLLLLPDIEMGTSGHPMYSMNYLIVGGIHAIIVVLLLARWLLCIRKSGGARVWLYTKVFLVVVFVILWLAVIGSSARRGYLRNKTIKIPEHLRPAPAHTENGD
ncbi:MAG: hypothetical protein ACYSWZ_12730 [Planctomycetota bacterium]